MSAELIEDDYQFEIDGSGLVLGAGTDFENAPPGWGGIGTRTVKTQDVELDGQHGSFLGRDFYAAPLLTFPVTWHGEPEDVMTLLDELHEGWALSEVDDIELWMRLPGWGLFSAVGRPRDVVPDLSLLGAGEGAALLVFQTSTHVMTREVGS